MSIDPRLKERRRDVAEDRAKRNVVRLLRFLASVVVLAAAVWLIHSPWLSVSQVAVAGVKQSDANRTLALNDLVAGTPMYRIDSNAIEGALMADPWIAEASVSKNWPNHVVVDIVERVPVAWALTSDGWTRRALDGVAVPSGPEPPADVPRIELPTLASGDAADSSLMLGALEFVDALDQNLRAGTVVRINEAEVWATVAGFQARLGRPVEMRQKARSLGALLDQNLVDGSVLILIAPTNPSVQAPEATPSETDDSDSQGVDQ